MLPPSPFLDPGLASGPDSLAVLQLKRDHLIPAILSSCLPASEFDYAEGKVINTRFGSFPHSTLTDQPWGTQILASIVDTGARGSKKRKRNQGAETFEIDTTIAKAATASSGFVHLIAPTPETWTLSLPHRTQVVYTPDYSYILQRLRARPGDHIIEAGAGSGSFTHAAARAVFNGYPGRQVSVHSVANGSEVDVRSVSKRKQKRHGRVFSFEFHEPRATQLTAETVSHGLDSIVRIANRDVYSDGFCLPSTSEPDAELVFLDLPAPWQALKHLTRSPPSAPVATAELSTDSTSTPHKPFRSPLNPRRPVRICTFSPCIEQVIKTVSALRSLGWVEIDMVEVIHKRLEVRRERVGLQEEGLRGANASAATVQEAVQRLRDVEDRAKAFHGLQAEKQKEIMRKAEKQKRGEHSEERDGNSQAREDSNRRKSTKGDLANLPPSKHDRLERARANLQERNLFREGRLVHRTEPELKTHTSYLVFAILPREWNKEDEEAARKKWAS